MTTGKDGGGMIIKKIMKFIDVLEIIVAYIINKWRNK